MTVLPHTKKQRWLLCITIFVLLFAAMAFFVCHALWGTGFTKTEDSFFASPFLTGKTVLVLVAHPDDETNLAFGIIDAFVQAGSEVTIAIATNGDAYEPGAVRAAETVAADALLGVDKDHIVLLGYADHLVPPYFYLDKNLVRESEAGYTKTYGLCGIPDYHTLCCGQAAEYTCANFEGDIRRLIETLRPDILLVSDTDYHIDHVSVSQSFDTVMGQILRDTPAYRPLVLKGYCYDYAWYGNDDFYNFLTLQSAVAQWNPAAYNTAFAWEDRIRFPLPAEYLSYTLRSSKLHAVLSAYQSQAAVAREGRMLNGDRLLWERRTDRLWADDVTASSGDASLLQDFLISDTMEAPLRNCWIPDRDDPIPTIQFTWNEPQAVSQIVFYDAPPAAGDIFTVRVTADTGYSVTYMLPDGGGLPCRLDWADSRPVQTLTFEILASAGDPIGLSEIEILPARTLATQWIHLLDDSGNFIYEAPCPAGQRFALGLYGYPAVPAQATATLTKAGSGTVIAEINYQDGAFQLPPLPKGRYLLRAEGGGCTVEALLRAGDTLWAERLYRFIERQAARILPD